MSERKSVSKEVVAGGDPPGLALTVSEGVLGGCTWATY